MPLQSLDLQQKVYDPISSWQMEYARMKVLFCCATCVQRCC